MSEAELLEKFTGCLQAGGIDADAGRRAADLILGLESQPDVRATADHSIPYVVACALARGTVNREDLDESQLADPRSGGSSTCSRSRWTQSAWRRGRKPA
jgi:hypothetical protein